MVIAMNVGIQEMKGHTKFLTQREVVYAAFKIDLFGVFRAFESFLTNDPAVSFNKC